ncbi:PIN domain-containing protein [Synechococcales cyanobacterium C]|uniref:PIN domain-containing protein n=1 Tax=Petrachloros mirabilis ULC683 TaxID=2781853 RepID=A0A8K2A2G6_9CYAN|nr:type II toxin-antitoxin system VapC family toxin [Petrachloros mirabilis]NCJ08561.1 PIN domain-containing protein [Petrachloros mirabilis ULC683]
MPASVYLETSFISYLTARPSRDIVLAGHQQTTRDWWQTRRSCFEVCISELVLQEVSSGDYQAAEVRLSVVNDIELLEITPDALQLADKLVAGAALPQKAVADALHIAIAVSNGIDFLLTWNCKHIANATMRSKIEVLCRKNGYEPSIICTPEELLEDEP